MVYIGEREDHVEIVFSCGSVDNLKKKEHKVL